MGEWRLWQHKSFPTNTVDHSLRCQHFIKVMEMIDQMRDEPEGECRYENQLKPQRFRVKDGLKQLKPRAKLKKTSHQLAIDPDFITELPQSSITKEEQKTIVENDAACKTTSSQSDTLADRIVTVDQEHSNVVDRNANEAPERDIEEDLELRAMFYLPKWDCQQSSCKTVGTHREQSLEAILSNVSELLSRPPPSLDLAAVDILCSQIVSPKSCPPFEVSFNIENEHEEEMDISEQAQGLEDTKGSSPSRNKKEMDKGSPVHSPTWEDVFEDDVFEGDTDSIHEDQRHNSIFREVKGSESANKNSPNKLELNKSMDLFADDEAFLQMSIPDVSTPENSPCKQPENSLNKYDARMKTLEVIERAPDKSPCINQSNYTANESQVKSKTSNLQPESFEGSNDLFSVNFDLGFTMEDSDEDEMLEPNSAKFIPPSPLRRRPSSSSTPHCGLSKQRPPVRPSEARLSTPRPECANMSALFSSPVATKGSALLSPISTSHAATPRVNHNQSVKAYGVRKTGMNTSDSEEDAVVQKKKPVKKVNYFSSPEKARSVSDVDSPVFLKRKRASALDTSTEVERSAISDDDFQNESVVAKNKPQPERKPAMQKTNKRRRAHHFLDDEAELSEDEEAGVSSDEDDGEEQDRSLDGFVVDNSHFSQGLNDSEMHGVYLKSVRSPAGRGKFKMSYRNHHNMDIFSQIPENDETYAEDSFVVGSDEEEEQSGDYSEEEEDVGLLLPEESYVDGRRQYATRRRVFLHHAKAKAKTHPPLLNTGAAKKVKRARVIRVQDSSDEDDEKNETKCVSKTEEKASPADTGTVQSSSIAAKISRLSRVQKTMPTNEQQNERCRKRLENEHLLSDQLDFVEPESLVSASLSVQSIPSAVAAPLPSSVTLLVDGRCLTGAAELVTCLRQRHSASVHVCSLDSSYFIVSTRTAVERHSQSELASAQNRKRLAEKVTRLQGLFERVCLIVEKDRVKPGDSARPFQRTRYFDSTVAALVRTGLRLLWSSGPEDSAALLVDLARLEQRKAHGISVPLVVKGQHQEQALQMYLNLPAVNYVHALNMCHNFRSIGQLMNSSVEAIQKGGSMSRARAEEVYRFLRYSCDTFLINKQS